MYLGSKEVRVDKTFGHNILQLKNLNSTDESLIKILLVYLSFMHHNGFDFSQDLFGFMRLDPHHFAKITGLNINHLQEKHPDPYYFKHNSHVEKEEHIRLEKENGKNSQYRIWDNKFENALYLLKEKVITKNHYISTGKQESVEVKSYKYIDQLRFVRVKENRTWKIYYDYILSNDFIENLESKFFLLHPIVVFKLRKDNLDSFFIHLFSIISLGDYQDFNHHHFSITQFAELLGISSASLEKGSKGSFSKLKYRCSQRFNKVVHIYNENEKNSTRRELFLEWVKPDNARYKSVAKVSWNSFSQKHIKQNKEGVFMDLFFKKLYEIYTSYYRNSQSFFAPDRDGFESFLNDWLLTGEDITVKISKYISALADVYNKHPDFINKDNFEKVAHNHIYRLIKYGDANRENGNELFYYKKGVFHAITVGKGDIKKYKIFSHIRHFIIFIQEDNYYNFMKGHYGII